MFDRWGIVATVLLAWATVGIPATSARERATESPRARYNFNPGWRMFVGEAAGAESPGFDDTAWKPVTTPHAFNEDSAFRVDIHNLPTGIVWYRKHFKVPATAAGRKVYLEFEGIRHGGEFYLNGKWIGRSENGVMAFGLDVTDALKPAPQENILAARIDNSWNYKEKETGSGYQWSDRNFYANYGGINKNVWLHVTDRLHQTLPLYSSLGTTGVYMYASDFDLPGKSATVHTESEVRNDSTEPKTFHYSVSVEDAEGKPVARFEGGEKRLGPGEKATVTASGRVRDLHLWSWGYGYLYTVATTLSVEGVPVDTVRTRTGFRKTDFGNGVVKLNGRVLHLKGYAQRTTNEWPAVGINIPPWVSDFSNRLMVEGNANLVRWMHVTPSRQDVESCDRVGLLQDLPAGDSERDVDGRRWEQRIELMRDAIIYNRNSPSVLFYEAGNKGVSEVHMADMLALREKFDPHGGRAMGCREMLGSKTAQWGGEMLYINKSATKPMWQTEFSRDEAARKFWDDWSPPFHKDAPAYNRNQDSLAVEDVVRWYDYWRERPGTGRRVNGGGVNIIFADSNTHFRGENNYRRSGEVDGVRLPKDGYYVDRVMWDGWVDVEHPSLYLIGHWNYAPNTIKPVYVVSSAEKVELFVNGKSHGFGERSSQFLFTFPKVAWEAGELKAVGYDARGKRIVDDVRRTAGPPAALRLTPHTGPGGFRADGADLVLVDVEVIDAKGNRCPTANDTIHFTLDGMAEWRGGIAQAPENGILSRDLPVECGVNRALVRSTTTAGKITLTAKAEGLPTATVEMTSQSFLSSDGLADELPADHLSAFLGRGPTPPGDSVTPTRLPITIASATAGSNGDHTALTYDDNEATTWTSDGKPGTAWIRYDFVKPQTVSEVTLKMGNWRNRSYPIRIRVGDKIVFTGQTPRSLGYLTMTFPPTVGKSVRIELTGGPKDADAFGEVVEVTGKKLPEDAKSTAGTLSIVEAEIYGPVR